MKIKKHSILSVINAHADIERTMGDESQSNIHIRSDCNIVARKKIPSRIANYVQRKTNPRPSPKLASWGVLFGSEYIWAPEIGPMLVVCPANGDASLPGDKIHTMGVGLVNCSILQFETELRPENSLRIVHVF